MKGSLLLLALLALPLSACHINTIYEAGQEGAKATLKAEPKRAQTSYDWVNLWNYSPDNYYLEGNTDEGFPLQGNSTGSAVCSDQRAGDVFKLRDTTTSTYVNFDVYVSPTETNDPTSLANWTLLEENTSEYSLYPYRQTGYPYPNIAVTKHWETLRIHNDKPESTGPVRVINQNLETLLSLAPGEEGTIDRSELVNTYVQINTDSVRCNIGTTENGTELATDVLSYVLTLATPTEIWVWSNAPHVSIVNQTPWDMFYTKTTLEDIDSNTSLYNLDSWHTTIHYTLSTPLTILGDYPFQVRINDHEPTLATKVDYAGADYSVVGLYAVTIPSTENVSGATFTLESTAGTPTDVLQGTWATIAASFTALIPLLSISVFGNITIGALLLIPFTYSLIVLIFKLIKK